MPERSSSARFILRALAYRNYRLFFGGQVVSLVGTWITTTATNWLVYRLTGSAFLLGVVGFAGQFPAFVIGPFAGIFVDRWDRHRLLVVTQTVSMLQSFGLAGLVLSGRITLEWIVALSIVQGLVNAFDMPARQSFLLTMIDNKADLGNAIALNSSMVNLARLVGPSIAGLVIATAGEGWCFLIDGISYVAVIASLLLLDTAALRPSPPAPRSRGQLREGLRYVSSTPALGVPLAMMAVIGALAYEFQVVLPIVARETFGGGAEVYGFLTAAMGAGAVIGGLIVAGSGRTGTRAVIMASFGFGASMLLAAAAPTLPLELVAMTIVGGASVTVLAIGNSTLQLAARPDMRGRVMSLWAVAFLGTTPIGGPIAGWVSETAGGRAGLLMGGITCIVAAAGAMSYLSQRGRATLGRPSIRQT